jgi:hypothetical protein
MTRKHWIIGLAAGVLIALVLFLYLTRLVTVERHRGFFAPAWDPAGRYVYFVQRDTFGVTWGFGWEHFTPPAYAYAISDEIRLRRLERASGTLETLETWQTTPVHQRIARHYRGRIFNSVRAYVIPDADGVDYQMKMAIPRVPRSEIHYLSGRWRPDGNPGAAGRAAWKSEVDRMRGPTDLVLVNGREVMTVRGKERFPAAIVEIGDDGTYDILVHNSAFEDIYADGIPNKQLQERSRRPRIERGREMRRVKRDLVNTYRAEGLREGEALLKSNDRMEELGYYPKSPRLIAKALDGSVRDTPIFEISEQEFRVGMFTDIKAAIDAPGAAVKKSMGKYIVHRDFTTSRRLNAWLAKGNTSFVVRHAGTDYRMTLTRRR